MMRLVIASALTTLYVVPQNSRRRYVVNRDQTTLQSNGFEDHFICIYVSYTLLILEDWFDRVTSYSGTLLSFH